MQFRPDPPGLQHQFTGYGNGYVEVNGVRIENSVIVGGDFIDRVGLPPERDRFTMAATEKILARKPELALLGTGARLQFPDRRALAPLQEAGIGVEVMDTAAACRTFNILLAEGRRVVAALLVA